MQSAPAPAAICKTLDQGQQHFIFPAAAIDLCTLLTKLWMLMDVNQEKVYFLLLKYGF